MPTINENFLKLEKNYLFINIAKKVNAFLKEHPEADLIRMGIGDVTLPIAPVCVEAMKKGADEMGVKETFKGYEDSGTGYDFLKQAIADYYQQYGVTLSLDEIRVNDGAKSDCGNIVDIFGDDNVVMVTDPAYPVYVDSNKMDGRTIIYANSNESNGFAAMPDFSVHADLITSALRTIRLVLFIRKNSSRLGLIMQNRTRQSLSMMLLMKHLSHSRIFRTAFLK